MLVRIVKDWPYPKSFFGQTPNGDGVWGEVTFTEDEISACDYLLVLQRPPYRIKVQCRKGNAWLITQEPPTNYFRFLTRSFKYFDRVYTNFRGIRHPHLTGLQPVLPWHVLKGYGELTNLTGDKLGGKKDELVWITSNKNDFPGQRSRMRFMKFLEESQFSFNLYGRGFTAINDKFDGLFPCKYALAIENFSDKHYWTEKLADCFLSWCLPFYWGAPNLEEYFPAESFIRIEIDQPEQALMIIKRAIEGKEWERRLPAIEKARNLILNEYQFFPYVSKMIVDNSFETLDKQKVQYDIPANPYPLSYIIGNQLKYYWSRIIAILRGGFSKR
ncbi:MAG: glycosyltransferase family 10 [Chryseolinea sp.]